MQDWALPVTGNPTLADLCKVTLSNAVRSVRSRFSGGSFPTETVAYMECVRTDEGLTYFRDSADGDWVLGGPAVGLWARNSISVRLGDITAATKALLLCSQAPQRILRLSLVCETATTGSDTTNEWRVQLYNETAGVALFSGTVGTGTALAGVGGGAELADLGAFHLTPNQNADLAIGDVLWAEIAPAGSPTQTTLANVHLLIEHFPLG